MDFRAPSQELTDKENQGVPDKYQNGELPRVVSILKSSQKANCLLEKKSSKVSFKNSPVRHTVPHRGEEQFDWEEIRKLDDEQNWTERTQVVTKEEHNLYIETARELLDQLFADLPCFSEQSSTATDMTTSSDLPEINAPEISFVNNIKGGIAGYQDVPDDDLETELMSDFSKLQINSNDYPRTFSPIGSERTSPEEQDNLMDSNEDIEKLLAPHENDNIEDDVLSTGNARTDNLLREITSEEHSYKSAELFSVNPSELENEFQEDKPLEDLIGGEKTEEVQDLFEKNAEDQLEMDDQFGDEMFKPASEAMWELDFLEKCGNSNEEFQMSALARQSLYVKFDPLVKGTSNQTPVKGGIGVKDMAPQKPLSMGDNLLLMDSPAPSARTSVLPGRHANRDQALLEQADSPCGVDKLLIFSPSKIAEAQGTETKIEEEEEIIVEDSNSVVETQTTPEISNIEVKEEESPRVKARLYTKEELDAAVNRETEALRKQALFCSKEEFAAAVKKETDGLRQQMQEEATIREMESKELTERNQQLRRETGELRVVMQEYEKTIADMIEKYQKSQDQYNHSTSEVAKERDQLQSDLTAVETAFSDLHRRYEKLKGVVENFKKNEEILKKTTSDYQEKLKRSEEKYRMLKKHAEEKIESANVEIARVRKSNESEIAVMKAALKKEQTKSASLEMSLQQKISENAELTSICDELINKMGGQRS